jgi:hypothetical protein
VLYLAIRLAIVGIVAIGCLFNHDGVLDVLSRWDGAWYLRVVSHGYPRHLPTLHGVIQGSDVAFFPLFPLLIRVLSLNAFLSVRVVGLLVSALGGAVAIVGVGLLTREFTTQDRAERAALLFSLTPGTFVFSLIYSESVFLPLVIFGVLALMRRRFVLAGVLGALACLTSPAAIAFLVPAGFVTLKELRQRQWRALVAPGLPAVAFVSWLGVLNWWTQTTNAWRVTEQNGWHSYPSVHYAMHILANFLFDPKRPVLTGHMLFWCSVAALAACYWMFKEKLPSALIMLGLAEVVIFMCSAPVGIRPRFLTISFPLAIATALHFEGKKFRWVLVISVLAMVLMTYETLTSFAIFP